MLADKDIAAPAGSQPSAVATPMELPRAHVPWFALRQNVPCWLYNTAAAASFVSVFLIWLWASHSGQFEEAYLPKPETVWQSALDIFHDETIGEDVKISLFRV